MERHANSCKERGVLACPGCLDICEDYVNFAVLEFLFDMRIMFFLLAGQV